ncbi:MAG: nicotinate (nicotinamide) nucleotide adenylyltransferase [Polyangiaceae bacterium]|nr:nicotinate (nicotinamide) nucleotide adenylyltransferase [Polyangiaceae bacterium]
MRVAVFGGSFNPPHVAHVLACAYVLGLGVVDRILVVPVFRHPFDKQLAPFADRLAMAQLALGWLPQVAVSDVEQDLEAPSLTLRTLRHLSTEHPDWSLRLMVGSDVLFDAPKWHAFDDVVSLAPLLVVGRVGHPHPQAPAAILPDVSSTEVRALLRSEPEGARLAALVPRRVLDHALGRDLYR